MTGEELFKAMDAIPDELLLRSEGRSLSESPEEQKRIARRKRIPMMIMSSAALGIAAGILFVVMAGPVLSLRKAPGAGGVPVASAPAAETAGSGTYVASAQDEAQTENSLLPEQAEEEIIAETEEAESAAPEESADSARTDANEGAEAGIVEGTETVVAEATEETAAEAESEMKGSADLLGDLSRDYAKVEYISAADLENGASPTEPAYSEEGEEALSRAINEGKPRITLSELKAQPLYYVYLTKNSGETEEMVVYEGGYVTLSSMSGMYMKVPDEVLSEVEEYLK